MRKILFILIIIFVVKLNIFSQDSQLNYYKILSGIWYTTEEPNNSSSRDFSWGSSITVPNGTFEIDLLTEKKIITIPGFGTFNVISIASLDSGEIKLTFYFNRGDFDASIIINIIQEDEIRIIKYENLDIHILSSPIYYKISGPTLATLNDSKVRIRKEPNLDGEHLGYLNKDQVIYIIDKTAETMKIGEMDSIWYKIKTLDGVEGWAYGYFIDLEKNKAVIKYDLEDFPIIRRIDEDMVSNVNVIYRSESDAILNLNEIEPDPLITNLLDKPIKNKNIQILSEYASNSRFNSIEDVLKLFEIVVLPSDIEKIYNQEVYRNIIIKTSDLKIVLTKNYNQRFRLFILEYSTDGAAYDFELKVGVDKDYIKENLGQPTAQSSERNIWVYESFKTLRQINIFFEDDIAKKIQLVAWGGI